MSGALMDVAIAEVGSKAWQVQTLDTPASGQMECPEPISFSKFTSEAMKTKAWKDIAYTWHPSKQMAKDIKLDRKLWKRSLTDILQASEEKLLKMLLQDGLFSSWYGKLCPRCGKGTVSKLQSGVEPRHR